MAEVGHQPGPRDPPASRRLGDRLAREFLRWYLVFLLEQPNRDRQIREFLFETLMTSADRRFAVEQIVGTRVTKLLDEADARW